ncbi:hypothetical protein ACJJTC_017833 [Scirpophaga incertulas]
MSAYYESWAKDMTNMYGTLQVQQNLMTNKLAQLTGLIDEMKGYMTTFIKKFKQLKLQNRQLTQSKLILEAKLNSVERKVRQLEETQLVEHMEIANILHSGQDEVKNTMKEITAKLIVVNKALKTVRRLSQRTKRSGRHSANRQSTERHRSRHTSVGTQTRPDLEQIGWNENMGGAACGCSKLVPSNYQLDSLRVGQN